MAKDVKYDLSQARRDAEDKLRTVDFQVDTLENDSSAGGYFTPDEMTVTINYNKNNEKFNEWSHSLSVLVHEQKHRDNHRQGMFAYALSSEQAYKANMHNEISANMASLLALRNEYLKTGDLDVFQQDELRFSFYVEAIKKGEINPFSNKQEDFDKEMALIVNGTRDMWEQNFATTDTYIETGLWYADTYKNSQSNQKQAAYFDQNYERAKKIAYTIGGVDFTKYMDKDVEIPEIGKIKMASSSELPDVLDLPKYDGKMSLQQYQKLLQHAFVMKDNLVGLKSKGKLPFKEDVTVGEWNMEMSTLDYLMNDKKLSDFKREDYNNALENVAQNYGAQIGQIINQIAIEYEKRGEKLPEGDDKAYNDAVNKLYTGHVNINADNIKFNGNINLREAFNPNDDLPMTEIPKYAKMSQEAVEEMGMWKRGLKQYSYLFGKEYDTNSKADWPAIVRYPVEAIEVYVGTPLVAGAEKCMELGEEAVDKVKGWFSDEKVKQVENEPIVQIDKNKTPEYKEWSPEQRVSEVQKRQIIDLTADVIRQPGRGEPDGILARKGLKNDMQNDAQDKARMLKVIEGMNRINGAKYAIDAQKTVDALYEKFGDNAYDLLSKAVNEPANLAQNIGDNSIKTSRAAVNALCNSDDKQTQALINAVLQQNGR